MRNARSLTFIITCICNLPLVYAADYSASLDWSRRVELSTPVSGVVSSVKVKIGDRVEKGEVMLTLDDRVFASEVKQAQAKVSSTAALRDEAKRELDRAKELYERTILSDHDLQIARIGYKKSLTAYQGALKQLTKAQQDLDNSSVKAPFNALVIQKNADIGQTVSSQMQPPVLLVVADSENMLARALFSEADITHLKPGQSVTIRTGNISREGRLQHLGFEPIRSGDTQQKYEAVFIFSTQGSQFRKGQPAVIEIP